MTFEIRKFCPLMSTADTKEKCQESCAWFVKEDVPDDYPETGCCAIKDIALELRNN